MNNSDMPAMPSGVKGDVGNFEQHPAFTGFTKREEITSKMLAALLSGVNGDASLHNSAAEWRVETVGAAIEFADELLLRLEKTKETK